MLGKLFRDLRGGTGSGFMPFYEQKYAPLLGPRASGFRAMLTLLEARTRGAGDNGQPLLIVETGSMRKPGSWGDGQSTLIWTEFARFHRCEIHTVDLNPAAGEVVRAHCGAAVQAHTGDSVAFLHGLASPTPRRIDLLYLDSYDFEPDNPFPSAFHHVKELLAARPCLAPGSIVGIDDNFADEHGQPTGKGYLAAQWFADLGIAPVHSGYQMVWQL
jgi:hypothetical protein